MKHYRPERVGSLIEKELGKILQKEVETENALVTITSAEVSKDLESAKVWISIYPFEKAVNIVKSLQKACGRFQRLLNKKLNIKPMPRIEFEIDRGPERAAGVERALLKK